MSEIFVDTIRKTGGSLGTDIRVKNTSVYESDGGTSVTQNLVQGVAKAWAKLNDAGTTQDSLNISSTTETSTALYTITINNDMSNADYSLTAGTHYAELVAINSVATGSYALRTFERADSLTANDQITHSVIFGDLA